MREPRSSSSPPTPALRPPLSLSPRPAPGARSCSIGFCPIASGTRPFSTHGQSASARGAERRDRIPGDAPDDSNSPRGAVHPATGHRLSHRAPAQPSAPFHRLPSRTRDCSRHRVSSRSQQHALGFHSVAGVYANAYGVHRRDSSAAKLHAAYERARLVSVNARLNAGARVCTRRRPPDRPPLDPVHAPAPTRGAAVAPDAAALPANTHAHRVV